MEKGSKKMSRHTERKRERQDRNKNRDQKYKDSQS